MENRAAAAEATINANLSGAVELLRQTDALLMFLGAKGMAQDLSKSCVDINDMLEWCYDHKGWTGAGFARLSIYGE